MFRPGKDQKIHDVWNGRKSVFLSDVTAKKPAFHCWHAVARLAIFIELLYGAEMMVVGEIFDDIGESQPLVRLARKYIWWTDPMEIITNNLPRLIASVMELGTWEDAGELRRLIGDDEIRNVVNDPPFGIVSPRSLSFWCARLGIDYVPSLQERRFR